jgi:hypothetical protein
MNTPLSPPQSTASALSESPVDDEAHSTPQSLDRTLTEIRSGRRLESIVASIESFLDGQIGRLELAINECNKAVENDKIVQRILANFELEQRAWEENRQAEIVRLQASGAKLINGWEKLENERRKFWEERNSNAET